MAETVIGKDTVAWLKIDVFDLTGNQLQEGPEEGWQVLFGHNDIFPKLEQALMGLCLAPYIAQSPDRRGL